VAVRVTSTFTSITSPPQAFAVQIESNNATAGSVVVDIDNFAQGSMSGTSTAAEYWESVSQQLVTAIRNNADSTHILIPGYGWSGAKDWAINHSDPWITNGGSIAYEAHYYFDQDNSGDYPDTYATENAIAVSGGYASLGARAVAELGNFANWCTANGVRGFIGEIGWPNTADTSSWNAVGESLYDLLDTAAIDVTYWAAGERWGTTYNLSIYTGVTQNTLKSQAVTVEAHPSLE
jgi:endoglucanase